ncbi:MAG: hypothetical protein RO469_04700 [Thermincola sp.]|jgi:ribosomal protein L6P/L9E|nr:hypothetical protein [Thermincola sp.]MDT3703808.1 hypothetical protein [Thermincola sp.]
MKEEQQKCPYTFSVEETEEGYSIHVKGDKEELKAKLEAMEAFWNFREKAKAAALNHHHRHHHRHHCGHGFRSLIHKHIEMVRNHYNTTNNTESKTAE